MNSLLRYLRSKKWSLTNRTSTAKAGMEPTERVNAFIAGYLRAHQQLAAEADPKHAMKSFDRWEELVTELDAEHAINQGCMELAGVMQDPCPHIPGQEEVVSVRHEQEKVFVETCDQGKLPHYYEYELWRAGSDWRIARIRYYLCSAAEPLVADRVRPRFTDPAIIPLRELPEDDAGVGGNALFVPGRQVRLDDDESVIEVRPVGKLNVPSGRLVVGDLGYDADVLGVLGQPVPPGEYPAEVSMAFGRIAALRVRFLDKAVERWLPADHNCYDSPNYVVGVDAGNVAIMDLDAVLAVKSRDKERAFEAYAENAQQRYSMLSLVHSNDAVISDSGFGDGGYPFYWGVGEDGRPAVLVVEFMLFPSDNV
ncbi:MAG TPA: DUF4241 domain-containing protein [Pseudoduganella sp.]